MFKSGIGNINLGEGSLITNKIAKAMKKQSDDESKYREILDNVVGNGDNPISDENALIFDVKDISIDLQPQVEGPYSLLDKPYVPANLSGTIGQVIIPRKAINQALIGLPDKYIIEAIYWWQDNYSYVPDEIEDELEAEINKDYIAKYEHDPYADITPYKAHTSIKNIRPLDENSLIGDIHYTIDD